MRLTLSSLLGKETRRGRREMCVNTWWAFSSARETSQDYRNRYFTWCYIPHMHVGATSHTCMSVLHPTHACRFYIPHMHVGATSHTCMSVPPTHACQCLPHMLAGASHTCMSVLHPTHAYWCYIPHMHVLIQVCVHIIDSVHTEMVRMKEEWEATCIKTPPTSKANKQPSVESSTSDSSEQESDSYCFELLSMLIGLSQSEVGCGFLSEQNKLIHDLFTLLHVATLRIQLQVSHLSLQVPLL